MNKCVKITTNDTITENPIFMLLLGMCPTLATAMSAINRLGIGLATALVLICSSVMVSLPERLIPDTVRIPVFTVVIAGFVTALQIVIKAYMPASDQSLDIFMPLIVVSCIILERVGSTVSKSSVGISLSDGVGIRLGFIIGLTLLATVRETPGGGTFFGMRAYPGGFSTLLFVLPPGAFVTLGLPIGIYHVVTKKR